jgi:hypothetical protein
VDLSGEDPNMNGARNCVQENYWHALDGSVLELEFQGNYSQYRWQILSSPRKVCLLTLTRGPVNPHRLCWLLGPAGGQRLSFYFGC